MPTYRTHPYVPLVSAGYIPPDPPPPVDPPGDLYWNENWTSAIVPTDWLTEINTFGTGDAGDITYAFVADPLGANGTVLRFRCVADGSKPTDYSGPGRQLVSFFRGAGQAYSGYNQIDQETWYRVKLMYPAGNAWSDGDANFTIEWHVDNSTQGIGNSSAILTPGTFPLTSDGTTSPRGFGMRWNAGQSGSLQETYWPSSNGTGSYAAWAPVAFSTNTWYDHVIGVKWSTNPAVGFVKWYLDGVEKMNRTMQTNYVNPANFNNSSYQNFGIYIYRYNITLDSTIYFDLVRAGETKTGVEA